MRSQHRFWRSQAPGVVEERFQLLPGGSLIEPDSNPTGLPYIGRGEKSLGATLDEMLLGDVLGFAPDSVPARPMMIGRVGIHGKELVFYPESGFPPGMNLMGLRECQTNGAQLGQRIRAHFKHLTGQPVTFWEAMP